MNTKKLLSFFLALVMCLGMLPMGALAAEEAVVADMPEELLLTLDEEPAEEEVPAEEETPVEEETSAEEETSVEEETPVETPAAEDSWGVISRTPVQSDVLASDSLGDAPAFSGEEVDAETVGIAANTLAEGMASGTYAQHNAIIIDPDSGFIGSTWTYGETIEIPFYLYNFGYSGERYYVYIYNESGNIIAGNNGLFPEAEVTYLTLTWDSYPSVGKYYVRFYATYPAETDNYLFAFYIVSGSGSGSGSGSDSNDEPEADEGPSSDSSAGKAINSTNFPSSVFRSYVRENIDTNNDDYLSASEIAAVKVINCYEKGITSMTGVELFTSLEELWCGGNSITSLDVSALTELKVLNCEDNRISALNVTKNTKLTYLDCGENSISSLDLSTCTGLTRLYCGGNNLTALNVSGLKSLEILDCRNNDLTSLNVTKNTRLFSLFCAGNNLSALDVSQNRELGDLLCENNDLSVLDIGNCSKIVYAYKNATADVKESSGGVYLYYETTMADSYQVTLSVDQGVTILQTVTATGGWQQENGKWYYYEGGEAVTGWKRISGSWYYFNASGIMQTGWQKISGKWYYLNSSGAMGTGWQKISGSWYYLGTDGVMRTGWQAINGNYYYLGTNGVMLTGWQQIGGKWYYFNASGTMLTGWQKIGGKWYYLKPYMLTGWQQISGKWYYLKNYMQTGWQQIGGKWYYLNNYMLTGWQKVGGKWYYLKNYMLTGWQKIGGEYYYLGTNGAMQTGWVYVKGWYYLKSDGTMASSESLVIGGTRYFFNADGSYFTL